MRRFMTKKQVESDVRSMFRELVERGDANPGDDIMRREMFNDYLDSLMQDRAVPANADQWTNPF